MYTLNSYLVSTLSFLLRILREIYLVVQVFVLSMIVFDVEEATSVLCDSVSEIGYFLI